MINIKETSNGNIAIIVGKAHRESALKVFMALGTEILAIEAGVTQSTSRTLADVTKSVIGVQPKFELSVKTKEAIARTTAGIPTSSEEIRKEISGLISEVCAKDRLQFGKAWNKAYRLLYDKTGFDVRSVEPVMNQGTPSLILTVMKYGKGTDMVRVLRMYLDN